MDSLIILTKIYSSAISKQIDMVKKKGTIWRNNR